ncbi:hypothetical protein J5Y09_22680 [Roseomonas sp. PWR1]|uniref:Uncharacterized protein n=1 Tax=Roseomonas nitratireducens TaxID=2820810 RepID=A0ABS4B1N1_9PROT|nr:hypothetical protein [Neoroseomonas nitratireducens]MBP0466752.1 hypothetical protein [Neoroseomonas nitratireducens]
MTDPDATVRLPRPAAPGPARGAAPAPTRAARPSRLVLAGGAAVLLAGAGAAALWLWLGQGPAEPPPKPEAPGVATPAPTAPSPPRSMTMAPPADFAPPVASEEAILAHRAERPVIFRLDANPRVFVVDFPGLEVQGATLNRVAALVEKAGQPRDRVLPDAALAAAITASGETAGTYYYGHNYRGRDLERFFALADRDGIALNAEEQWLRREVARLRRLVPAPEDFALVSVPGLEPRVDAAMRRAILHHEIGHGHFFTDARFAAHVALVWRDVFTEQERARFRAFLEREGYDPALEEVMMNEAMSYLIFTPDPRFFTPAHAGLDDVRADVLRAALRAGAPR